MTNQQLISSIIHHYFIKGILYFASESLQGLAFDDKVEFDICGGLRREMSDCGQTLPSPHYTSNIRMQETRMLSGLPPHNDGFTASKTEAIKRSQFVTKTKYVLTL